MAVNANSAVPSAAADRSSNRRTIIKGAAWSVPVIAAAVAAPAASASTGTTVPDQFLPSISVRGIEAGGVVGNITMTQGRFTIIGAPGDTTGLMTLTYRAPAGYTEWDFNSDGAGVWSLTESTGTNGAMILTFTFGGITIEPGEILAQSPAFPVVTFIGSGATATNQATYTANCVGYSSAASVYPAPTV